LPATTTGRSFSIVSHIDGSASLLRPAGRYVVLFVIDLVTRRVQIAGIRVDPCETQMLQCARNRTDGSSSRRNRSQPTARSSAANVREIC
jgi:hypothetical protein